MKLRVVVGALVMTGAVGLLGGTGSAAPALNITDTIHGPDVFYDTRPCTTDTTGYEITAMVNGVEHEGGNANGGHFTFTETGTFTARPAVVERDGDGNPVRNDDDELTPVLDVDGNVQYLPGETFTGRFTVWGGGNFTRGGNALTFTATVRGVGSEGTTFFEKSVFHVNGAPGDLDDEDLIKRAFGMDTCR